MRDLCWNPVHVRLSEFRAGAGRFVRVRRGLRLRSDVHVQGLPARERADGGEPLVDRCGDAHMHPVAAGEVTDPAPEEIDIQRRHSELSEQRRPYIHRQSGTSTDQDRASGKFEGLAHGRLSSGLDGLPRDDVDPGRHDDNAILLIRGEPRGQHVTRFGGRVVPSIGQPFRE